MIDTLNNILYVTYQERLKIIIFKSPRIKTFNNKVQELKSRILENILTKNTFFQPQDIMCFFLINKMYGLGKANIIDVFLIQ